MGPLGAFTLQPSAGARPFPEVQSRAGQGRGGEVALISSLTGKAETLIHSALALGDSAALPPAPTRAQHQHLPQPHPKAKPGCHSLGLLPPAPSLTPQVGSQDPQERGEYSPPASSLESITPCTAQQCGDAAQPCWENLIARHFRFISPHSKRIF